MALVVPATYHARELLHSFDVPCLAPDHAVLTGSQITRVGIINLMPRAEEYEPLLLRAVGQCLPLVQPVWIRVRSHSYSSSDRDYLEQAYVSYEQARATGLDGLILTGAPVEDLPYERVRYWQELAEILEDAHDAVPSTLGLCWGGMALAKLLNVEKVALPRKLFGVFPLQRHLGVAPLALQRDEFLCPQSRHSSLDEDLLNEAEQTGGVVRLAGSEPTGTTILTSSSGRYLMHLGHPEYEPERLVFEYRRDAAAGRSDVSKPENFDLEQPTASWRHSRDLFFSEWIESLRPSP
jgi:homoserine O-succinyltransferase